MGNNRGGVAAVRAASGLDLIDGRIVIVALYQIHIVGVRAEWPGFHRNLVPLWS